MINLVSARDALLRIARGHTWVVETGNNSGQAVNAILARTGLGPGYPWCAAFVAYCGWLLLREAWPLKAVAGCASLAEDAKVKGLLTTTPAPGGIFLLWGASVNRFRHTGFLWDQLPNGKWRTVEGNTNPGGSPEGTGVFIRERGFVGEDRFIDWWK